VIKLLVASVSCLDNTRLVPLPGRCGSIHSDGNGLLLQDFFDVSDTSDDLFVSGNVTPDFIIVVLTSFISCCIFVIIIGHDTMVFHHIPRIGHPAAFATPTSVILVHYIVTIFICAIDRLLL